MPAPTGIAASARPHIAPRSAPATIVRGRAASAWFSAFPARLDMARFYGSGADYDGGSQPSPDLNVGAFRSSSELSSFMPFGAMFNLTIERVGEANIPGRGNIDSDGGGRFRWTAPGSLTAGPWVYVPDGGGSIVLDDGTNSDHGIRVRRAGGPPAAGKQPVKLLDIFNGAFGWGNIQNADRAAGKSEYRAIFIKNVGITALWIRAYLNTQGTQRTVDVGGYGAAGGVTIPVAGGTYDWSSTGFVQNQNSNEVCYYSNKTDFSVTVPAAGRDVWGEVAGGAAGLSGHLLYPVPGLRIASETPAANGSIQKITNVLNAPTGRTFVHPSNITDTNAISINPLNPGSLTALWIQRKIIAGAVATALSRNQICVDHIV